MNSPNPTPPRLPLFMILFFSLFGFIGLTVLIFLWSSSSDGFGAPPLIFKLVGSFIALGFMCMGFGLPITAILHRGRAESAEEADDATTGAARPPAGYRCPHCGAGLSEQEVSPGGDVKCSYCHKWWNIHQCSK